MEKMGGANEGGKLEGDEAAMGNGENAASGRIQADWPLEPDPSGQNPRKRGNLVNPSLPASHALRAGTLPPHSQGPRSPETLETAEKRSG